MPVLGAGVHICAFTSAVATAGAHTWRGSQPALSGRRLLLVWLLLVRLLLVRLLVCWRLATSCLLGRESRCEAHAAALL